MKKLFTFLAVLLLTAMTAKAQTQPINIVCNSVTAQYYAADNDLFITMNSTDYAFGFDVLCATGSTDIVDGQTYTFNDMIPDYSYGLDYINLVYINYTSASLVRNSDGSYVADVTATDGTQYHITYTPAPLVTEPTDTVTVMMTNATLRNQAQDLISSMGAIQLIGYSDDDNYCLNVVFNTTTFAGSYTMADAYPDSRYFMLYSFAGGATTNIPCNNLLAATVTGTEANCTAHLEWVADNGTMYDIYYSNAIPDPTDTIDIVMDNAAINEVIDYTSTMGLFQLTGADQNQEYKLYLAVNSSQLAGSYTQDDISYEYSGLIHNGNTSLSFISVSDFTVTGNAQNCSTYVEILASNNVVYRINYIYTYVVPETTDTVDITMDNAEYNQIIDYTSVIGMYQLQGADQAQEYTMLLAINSDQIAGTYTMGDVDMYYSGLIHINGTDTSYIDVVGINDFTVTGNAKGCSTYVEITGSDNTLYRINYIYTYAAPEPVDTVVITMDNEENKVIDQTFAGMFQLIGSDANEEYVMQLVVYSDQIAGAYTQSDVETYYSALYHLTANDTTLIEIADIRDFTVTGDTTACSAYIEIISADLVLYKITFTVGGAEPIDPEAVENADETRFEVCSEGNAIMVYSEGEQDITVFDMAGRMITNRQNASDIERIEVSVPGIYVVRVGNRAAKAIVK